MNYHLILSIELSISEGLKISLGPIFFILAFFVIIIVMSFYFWKKTKSLDLVEINLDFKNPISFKIKPNHDTTRIAHQVWTELKTRKAAVPFDEQDDVILEIYDSWYSLFGIIRTLIKTIPAEHIKNNKDTKKLVNLLVDVLNLGLRPHLTKWQAKFRTWMKQQCENNTLSPQEKQRSFPYYDELVKDLIKVNIELNKFSNALYNLVHGD